jgi:hypothetical protein
MNVCVCMIDVLCSRLVERAPAMLQDILPAVRHTAIQNRHCVIDCVIIMASKSLLEPKNTH